MWGKDVPDVPKSQVVICVVEFDPDAYSVMHEYIIYTSYKLRVSNSLLHKNTDFSFITNTAISMILHYKRWFCRQKIKLLNIALEKAVFLVLRYF